MPNPPMPPPRPQNPLMPPQPLAPPWEVFDCECTSVTISFTYEMPELTREETSSFCLGTFKQQGISHDDRLTYVNQLSASSSAVLYYWRASQECHTCMHAGVSPKDSKCNETKPKPRLEAGRSHFHVLDAFMRCEPVCPCRTGTSIRVDRAKTGS